MALVGGSYVRVAMQTTHKISGDAAAGFAAYLTSTSNRGDYYAGAAERDGDGEEDGRWRGSSGGLARLGLAEPVKPGETLYVRI